MHAVPMEPSHAMRSALLMLAVIRGMSLFRAPALANLTMLPAQPCIASRKRVGVYVALWRLHSM